jgi:hypothetical protein
MIEKQNNQRNWRRRIPKSKKKCLISNGTLPYMGILYCHKHNTNLYNVYVLIKNSFQFKSYYLLSFFFKLYMFLVKVLITKYWFVSSNYWVNELLISKNRFAYGCFFHYKIKFCHKFCIQFLYWNVEVKKVQRSMLTLRSKFWGEYLQQNLKKSFAKKQPTLLA